MPPSPYDQTCLTSTVLLLRFSSAFTPHLLPALLLLHAIIALPLRQRCCEKRKTFGQQAAGRWKVLLTVISWRAGTASIKQHSQLSHALFQKNKNIQMLNWLYAGMHEIFLCKGLTLWSVTWRLDFKARRKHGDECMPKCAHVCPFLGLSKASSIYCLISGLFISGAVIDSHVRKQTDKRLLESKGDLYLYLICILCI